MMYRLFLYWIFVNVVQSSMMTVIATDVSPPCEAITTEAHSEATKSTPTVEPFKFNEPYLERENRSLLRIEPSVPQVEIDNPTEEEIIHNVTTRLIDVEGITGIELITRDRRVLRRFLDTNGDKKLDQWIYYRGGREVFRNSDTDFDGIADVAVHRLNHDKKSTNGTPPADDTSN